MFGKQIEKKDNVYYVSSENSNELTKLKYNHYTDSFEVGENINIPFNSQHDFKIFEDKILVLNESNNTIDIYDTNYTYLDTISDSSINENYFLNNDYIVFQQSSKKIKVYNIIDYLNSDVYSFSQVNRIDGANLSEYYFGISIVEDDINPNVIAIGSNGGKVKIYNINESYNVKHEIEGDFSENFGSSIVFSNRTIVISAPNKNDKKGSIYIYRKNMQDIWEFKEEIEGKNSYEYFGDHIEKKDNLIFVFSKNKNKGNRGSIDVYYLNNSTSDLSFITTINKNHKYKLNNNFTLVDNLLVIQSNNNKVLIFEEISNEWTFKEEFSISEHRFGEHISFNNDRLLIGSPNEEKAYIYEYDNNLKEFNLSFELIGINHSNNYLYTNFGYSGAVTESAIIIGAPNYNEFRGAFFVFDLNGNFIDFTEGTNANQQVGFLINAVNESLLFINAYGVN